MLSTVLVGLLLLSQSAAEASTNAPVEEKQPRESRGITAITREITELLKTDSTAESDAERAAAINRLVEIHREIVGDARFTTNELWQQQRNKVCTRLTSVRDEIKRRLATEKRRGKTAKQIASAATAKQLAAHYSAAGEALAGPTAIMAGGGGPTDLGQELIDLIQTTIEPASWNVNGGKGSIMYYSPVFALVVRASSEVHAELGDELDALRAAGK